MVQLDGKAVVVTGAGRGLGRAYAEAVAAAGGSVVVNDVDGDVADEVVAGITASGGTAVALRADVSVAVEATRIIERCVEEFGSVDGLVNNAGYGMIDASAPEDQDPDELRRVFEVNVLGTAYCAIAAIAHMRRQGSGSIINDTSAAMAGTRRLAAYSASKGAAASFVLGWAADLEGTGVRVNGISPMAVTRAWNWELLPDPSALGDPERLRPQDNAGLVVYLLSDRASGITGQLMSLRAGNLNVISHQLALDPTLFRDEWPAEAVADAFDTELAGVLQPAGLRRARIEFTT
jgi:NAD(P)-dependent dehydrogenase (short-subunit alcohol dehydrogenase family)